MGAGRILRALSLWTALAAGAVLWVHAGPERAAASFAVLTAGAITGRPALAAAGGVTAVAGCVVFGPRSPEIAAVWGTLVAISASAAWLSSEVGGAEAGRGWLGHLAAESTFAAAASLASVHAARLLPAIPAEAGLAAGALLGLLAIYLMVPRSGPAAAAR